jgi:hypothetical protein
MLSYTSIAESGKTNPLVLNDVYREGNFELSNTTEVVELMEYGAQENAIGRTYNITINLDASSTSSINLSLTKHHSWRGSPSIFQMTPNETKTVTYVQHSTSDELGILNFDYHLLNTSGVAKGTYEVILVSIGYPADIGTGILFVDNITKWLIEQSQTSSTSLHSPFSLPFLILTILIIYSYRKSEMNIK